MSWKCKYFLSTYILRYFQKLIFLYLIFMFDFIVFNFCYLFRYVYGLFLSDILLEHSTFHAKVHKKSGTILTICLLLYCSIVMFLSDMSGREPLYKKYVIDSKLYKIYFLVISNFYQVLAISWSLSPSFSAGHSYISVLQSLRNWLVV